MAFSSTITPEVPNIVGNKKMTWGTYASTSGSTGGDIDTGLAECDNLQLQPGGSAVKASAPVVNETLPVVGSAVTVVTVADETGTWVAWGR